MLYFIVVIEICSKDNKVLYNLFVFIGGKLMGGCMVIMVYEVVSNVKGVIVLGYLFYFFGKLEKICIDYL